jgi:PleD family two-component response regulator
LENQKRKIVAVLNDLMFQVKIQQAAKQAGFEPVFVQSQQDALTQAKDKPAVIILDLNHSAVEPLETIAKLKKDVQTSTVNLLGYVSHVQTDLFKAARDLGCDLVVPRSALSQNLRTILGRYMDEQK